MIEELGATPLLQALRGCSAVGDGLGDGLGAGEPADAVESGVVPAPSVWLSPPQEHNNTPASTRADFCRRTGKPVINDTFCE
jgi:hypothetical protein